MAAILEGMDRVMANLQKELKNIENRSIEGLLNAAIFIRREMDTTSPKIPVDTNKLRASWFTFPGKAGGMPVVVIGFSAEYAIWVHEMVDKGDINWGRDGAGPKFLEAHLDRNHKQILYIIAKNAKTG